MKKLMENLDAVCIREENSVANEILNGNYKVCIDPTLLFDMEDYEDVISEKAESELSRLFLVNLKFG